MAYAEDYTKILAQLNTKLARQKSVVEETEQHIAAITRLQAEVSKKK